jgi:hypothetical protein
VAELALLLIAPEEEPESAAAQKPARTAESEKAADDGSQRRGGRDKSLGPDIGHYDECCVHGIILFNSLDSFPGFRFAEERD